ncbi:MAG: tryptophan-rich sensory protein [Bacteroidetes bacterium]|nr:tryptophan-rich sensory protein [Bacteroidota bacterium]MCW5894324.1 tryptophan-rich sensory protein [Bacteroidota bacterium]
MNYLRLIASIVLCQSAGIVAAILTAQSVQTWYPTLLKPSFNPPNWLFGPVWITLYFMMGISLYLVWQRSGTGQNIKTAVLFFVTQLVLNAAWSLIFFGLQSPFWAFVEIVALWVAILITIILFREISRTASYLLVPYILWVTYAAILNFTIWRLNTGSPTV